MTNRNTAEVEREFMERYPVAAKPGTVAHNVTRNTAALADSRGFDRGTPEFMASWTERWRQRCCWRRGLTEATEATLPSWFHKLHAALSARAPSTHEHAIVNGPRQIIRMTMIVRDAIRSPVFGSFHRSAQCSQI
jgi:hypothetical protein